MNPDHSTQTLNAHLDGNLREEEYADLDMFTQLVVYKLHQEQSNRLKTEEQSAKVIEQLGMTIARLVSFMLVLMMLGNE